MSTPKRILVSLVLVLTFSILPACGGGGDGNIPPPVGSHLNGDGSVPAPVGLNSDSAILRWDAPLQRIDATPLSLNKIDGYKIFMGNEQNNLTLLTDITDASITTYTVKNLPSGTHYFAVIAYDTDGIESSLSNIKSKTL